MDTEHKQGDRAQNMQPSDANVKHSADGCAECGCKEYTTIISEELRGSPDHPIRLTTTYRRCAKCGLETRMTHFRH